MGHSATSTPSEMRSNAAQPTSGARPWPELHRGVLTDFVPAAGLRWLVVGAPAYFARHPALQPLRESWLTDARFRTFASSTGIDLTRTERGLVAGFDLGLLYMADGSGWVGVPEELFSRRLAGTATVRRPHPHIWRVTGLAGSTPESLVRVDRDLVAIAVRDPTPARIVELVARGRLLGVVPALRGAALSTLPADYLEPGSLSLYGLGPFEERALTQGRGLLGLVQAIAARVDLMADRVRLDVALSGYWHDSDRDRLSALWDAVATSTTGAALGLTEPLARPSVSFSELALELTVELSIPKLLSGIERVLGGDVERLLGMSGPSSEPLPN
jgi:hypothetical protein